MEQSQIIASNLRAILSRIHAAAIKQKLEKRKYFRNQIPLLVAVSKTKSTELIASCYEAGQRHFGENYYKELEMKANELQSRCPDIRWHFIGQLQSNKIHKLVAIPNLYCIESLSNEKHCLLLHEEALKRGKILRVLVQVNISKEMQKAGTTEEQAIEIAKFIVEKCASLKFSGFMMIGSIANENQDKSIEEFKKLFELRERFCHLMGLEENNFDLSMGMSNDFEIAILHGSSCVRIGSAIFGERS